jgi:cell wall-associated NlpC family hydrolase
MKPTGLDVYHTAKKLIGTPYIHQGRLPGIACDCLGVPVLVGQHLGLFDDHPNKEHILQTNYPRMPNGLLKQQVEFVCKPILLQAGALLLFVISYEEQHCGIVSNMAGGYGLIHAYDLIRPARVVEEALADHWIDKVTGCYGLPGVQYF